MLYVSNPPLESVTVFVQRREDVDIQVLRVPRVSSHGVI
jgi:hypothetical protein